MNIKSLTILGLALLLLYGVDSVNPKDQDNEIADKLFMFGGEVFLKFLDNVKTTAEKSQSKVKFSKTGNEMQALWNSLKELMEKTIAKERAKGNQDDFVVAAHIFRKIFRMYGDGLFDILDSLPNDRFMFGNPMGFFKGILKNETLVELWKDVGSRFFPEAPPINSDPHGFLSFLLSKIFVTPHMVRNLKVASEVAKTDIDQLYKDAQVAINQVREKAMEISALERQTEKNDFAVTLRTASGVLAFYWDKVLEYTEGSPFHDKYIDSIRQWKELRLLKNISENCYSETEHQALTWADQHFGNLFNNAGQEYYSWGDSIFGDERFNQSNWAIHKLATIYRLPIYEKLCQSGLGISEVNNFLRTANNALTELVGEEIAQKSRETVYELWTIFDNEILSKTNNIHMTSDVKDNKNPLQHLRTIKEIFFDIWDEVLSVINNNINEDEVQQSSRLWDVVRTIFIKELIDSGELTQENLDEAQRTLINVTHMVFEKYVKMIDGLDKRISASIESLGKVMLQTFSATNNALINSLVFLLSD